MGAQAEKVIIIASFFDRILYAVRANREESGVGSMAEGLSDNRKLDL